VSRGVASGDLDGDGDLDLLVTTSNGPVAVLRNVAARGDWILLRLLSRRGGRVAVGARVVMSSNDRDLAGEVQAGSSYLSQNDPRVHFGLGTRNRIDSLEVRWPEGRTSRIDAHALPVNRVVTIVEPAAP
jgi:hypothetical protein